DDPICGTVPRVRKVTHNLNGPGDFTHGWCGVHVVQYAKDIGDRINPLDSYQLEVKIFDAAGIQIGHAVRQSAESPLNVVNSTLPDRLIISAPGPDDDSPVEFWFADQYWNSNDKATHHCSSGGYDGGSRQGDCGFACGPPASPPVVSATNEHPITVLPIDAVGGGETYTNTYITTTAAAPPPPPPTPTYATGNCGLHVRQVQKWEKNLNDCGDYLLEVTLKDSNTDDIASSGLIPAPQFVPIQVNGYLNAPVFVTTDATDEKPLRFQYAGDEWFSDNEARCPVGDYDSGERNMDCNLAC
ncbi:hypothetical protein LTS18_010781, partial [Coniosporium uncinatum]